MVRHVGFGGRSGRAAPAKTGHGKPADTVPATAGRPAAGISRWQIWVALATAAAVVTGALALYGVDGVRENLLGLGMLLAVIAGFGKIVRAVYCLTLIFTGRMTLRDLRRK